MNEVKKLYEMGVDNLQTRYYLAKQNESAPSKVITVEQEPKKPLHFIGTLRVNEYGEVIHPPVRPVAPEPVDTSNWKRITPKRREKLAQYRRDKEAYEVAIVEYHIAMEKWMELTPINDAEPIAPIIIHSDDNPVLSYWAKGFGEVNVCSRPVTHTEIIFSEVTEEIQTGFVGNASQDRRKYKRNRDINEVLTCTTQQTLFECKTSSPKIRNVNEGVIDSFIDKPNAYLGRALLEAINGKELSDWEKFQLRKRIHYVGML